ncbi:hypothetical protein EIN_153830 [Entamoeba invadens IP1]|uniref:Helicase Helix-turn-helix domain-containing protein n=1 Tax=Entamoeba invadens IP1 TaxID=370355 RepID=A0A0A1UEV0_ENTIV|nr:hypothetical protein EIN_153830 [Entamoeba invadens IP1]ELP91346.1 hypothetical protein EIN_153830 [Entamoeba invadens IP1]|eukprot:XP_004258117.1 hypothetical protein EIN_153830 [Entamoeba invadens IP1]
MEDVPISPILTENTQSYHQPLSPTFSEADLTLDKENRIPQTLEEKRNIAALPRKPKNSVNEETLKVIHNMNQRKYKAKDIASVTELTKSTVYKYIERMATEKTDEMSSLLRKRGRKRTENRSMQSKIMEICDTPGDKTLKDIKDKLKEEGYDISISYLSKIMKRLGLAKGNTLKSGLLSQKDDSSFSMFTQQFEDMLPPPTN